MTNEKQVGFIINGYEISCHGKRIVRIGQSGNKILLDWSQIPCLVGNLNRVHDLFAKRCGDHVMEFDKYIRPSITGDR